MWVSFNTSSVGTWGAIDQAKGAWLHEKKNIEDGVESLIN